MRDKMHIMGFPLLTFPSCMQLEFMLEFPCFVAWSLALSEPVPHLDCCLSFFCYWFEMRHTDPQVMWQCWALSSGSAVPQEVAATWLSDLLLLRSSAHLSVFSLPE